MIEIQRYPLKDDRKYFALDSVGFDACTLLVDEFHVATNTATT